MSNITLHTQYITPDDFQQYFGINLGAQLKGNANPSDKAYAFLKRIEDRMQVFLNSTFFKNIDVEWRHMSDFQKEHYRLALLEQAIYVFKNGDIMVDSGYDPDEGLKISPHEKREIMLSDVAKMHLEMTGLWTRNIRSTAWFIGWFI